MRTCIVVEDSAALRLTASMMLERLGFVVASAESAEAALNMIHDSPPDLILLDWNLPGMSGIEFLNVLRQHPNGRNARVVFCTSHNTSDDICEAIAKGADEYIMKPFDERILASKLRLVGLM